jgi:hypothetical protein
VEAQLVIELLLEQQQMGDVLNAFVASISPAKAVYPLRQAFAATLSYQLALGTCRASPGIFVDHRRRVHGEPQRRGVPFWVLERTHTDQPGPYLTTGLWRFSLAFLGGAWGSNNRVATAEACPEAPLLLPRTQTVVGLLLR